MKWLSDMFSRKNGGVPKYVAPKIDFWGGIEIAPGDAISNAIHHSNGSLKACMNESSKKVVSIIVNMNDGSKVYLDPETFNEIDPPEPLSPLK